MTKAPPPPPAIEVATVRTDKALRTVTAVGSTVSNESVMLRSEVSGRIVAINFADGARVKAGTPLIRLDDSIEQAELARAEAELALAQANFTRASELRRSNVGTQRALDEAQSALKVAVAVQELARSRLGKRTLEAPFEAVAGLRRVSVGDYVTSGDVLVNLEQIDPLKVDFRIPELFLPALAQGQAIGMLIDSYPGQSFEGKVSAIDPLVDAVGRSVTVRAMVPNSDLRLRPGLFARVTLTLAERQDALFVPEAAIVPQGQDAFVFKVTAGPDGKQQVRRVKVELGVRRTGEVEVVQGLAAGERVVSAGVARLQDGAPVRLVPASGERTPLTASPASRSEAPPPPPGPA